MAQDDQTQKCSSSSGGGGGIGSVNGRSSSSKKPKQKKVPQRGLGVAQLEKIRLEEQQKKDAAVVAAAAILSSSPSPLSLPTKSSYISVPIPHYHHSNQSSSSIPFPSLPSVDTSSANSIFRPSLPAQDVDVMKPNTVPLTNLAHNDGYEISGLANVPKLWIPREYNFEKENSSGLDPGLALRSTLNLPYEPNTIWPLTVPVHRTQQHHQPPSMVNIPLSTSSSSVLSFQMEPPSNQSYYGNRAPMWPEEEKIVGMKRPYPFSLENPPGPPSFNFKFPTFVGPVRVNEPASCGINGSSFTLEPRNTKLREGPSCSTSNSELHSRNGIRENGAANGDFLTLALPTWTCTQIPKFNLPPAHLSFHNRESPNLETLHFKGSANEPKKKLQAGPSGSSEQAPPFYSFFPPANLQIGQAETTMNNCNGEVGENVDLNLKL